MIFTSSKNHQMYVHTSTIFLFLKGFFIRNIGPCTCLSHSLVSSCVCLLCLPAGDQGDQIWAAQSVTVYFWQLIENHRNSTHFLATCFHG
jgi:hypothetical protein